MLLGAIGAEKTTFWTRLAIGSDREAFATDLTILQLAWIRTLFFIHHFICQQIIVIIWFPSSTGLATGEFLALFYFIDGLFSLALFGLLFRRLWLWFWFWCRFIGLVISCLGLFFLGSLTCRISNPAIVVIADLRSGNVVGLDIRTASATSKE